MKMNIPNVYIKKLSDNSVSEALNFFFSKVCYNEIKNVKRVLIKPNLVVGLPSHTGATTDLEIIKEIVKIFKAKGISSCNRVCQRCNWER